MTAASEKLKPPAPGVTTQAPRSRGRPSKREAENIDRNVLESAKKSFLADGFAATTMDAIASRAGVTKATLYQRYDDKAALLRAVLQDRVAAWSAVSDARKVVRGDTLRQRLLHYARSMTRWSVDPEVRAFGDLVLECWGSARHVAVEMEALRTRRMQDVLERDICDFAAKEGLAVTDPGMVAALFMGMLGALHQYLERPNSPLSSEQIDDRLVQLVSIFLTGAQAWSLPG